MFLWIVAAEFRAGLEVGPIAFAKVDPIGPAERGVRCRSTHGVERRMVQKKTRGKWHEGV